jgi:hypothetical protein
VVGRVGLVDLEGHLRLPHEHVEGRSGRRPEDDDPLHEREVHGKHSGITVDDERDAADGLRRQEPQALLGRELFQHGDVVQTLHDLVVRARSGTTEGTLGPGSRCGWGRTLNA